VSATRRAWVAGLSDREVEVLRLVARGLSNQQIAARLSISKQTAGHHIRHIYDKIDVTTRAAATLFAMQHNLVHKPGELASAKKRIADGKIVERWGVVDMLAVMHQLGVIPTLEQSTV